MNKIALIIAISLILTGCQHSNSLDEFRKNSKARFFVHGANPSWTLKVSRTSISFQSETVKVKEKIDPSYFSSGEWRTGYRSNEIRFLNNDIDCFDAQLNRHFRNTVIVQVKGTIVRGCGGPPVAIKDDNLTKTSWRLERIDELAPIRNTMTNIRFSQGRMIAFVGCNRLSRNYSHKNGEIVVGSLQTTNFACSDPERQQEQRFLEIFGQRARLEFDRLGQLIIQNPLSGTLVMSQTI